MNELFNFLKPLSDRTTPRWIILVIDMLIVVLSCALVSASDTFNVATISRFDILRNYCVVVGVFLFVSFFSKSYAYIIRLTALNDLFRTLTLCIVSLIVLIVINVIVQQVTGSPWFGMWGIAMVVFTAFCLMTAERLSIKYLYFKLMHFGSGRRKAMIVGNSAVEIRHNPATAKAACFVIHERADFYDEKQYAGFYGRRYCRVQGHSSASDHAFA